MQTAKKFLLAAIIAIAIIFRFANLSTVPIGFNDDEAAFGYNAYSILKTGKDEWGRMLPFPVFESFGDWKLIGYLYPVVISESIFGKNVFAARFPSAAIGVIAILATYFLAKQLFDQRTALLSALLLAINPWHIVASRNAFESDVLIFFITAAVYLFLRGLTAKKFLVLSFLGFTACFYIYRSAWFFLPIFISTLIYFQRKDLQKFKNYFLKIIAISVFLLIPLLPSILTFSGQSRFFQESFITGVARSGIINELNEKRGDCFNSSPAIFCKVAYNKYFSFTSAYFNNYFENLSPQTYFTRGPARGYQSFSDRGLLYSFELPLLIAGLVFLLIKKHSAAKILIPWILIVPLGASFTGVGNPGRLNILLPAPQIIEAIGFFSLISFLNFKILKNGLIVLGILMLLISTARLFADMFYHYPKISAPYQRYGYQNLFDFLEGQKDNYSQIAISRKKDDAKQYIHYLFFEDIPPQKFFDPKLVTRYRGQDRWQVVEKIGNFYFYPSAPKLENLPSKSLLVTQEHEVPFPVEPIFKINYPNTDRAFEVYDIDNVKEKLKQMNEE